MRYAMSFTAARPAALLAALALTVPAPSFAAEQEELQVKQHPTYGDYVTGGEGLPVYLFTPDKEGVSTCTGECAAAWPPVLTESEPKLGPGASALQESLLGTIKRPDGEKQVTYAGKPLYYFAKDEPGGKIQGQDIHSFGGEWYLIAPNGKKIEATRADESAAAAEEDEEISAGLSDENEPIEVEPRALLSDTEEYTGRQVFIRAEIDERIGDRAFLLGSPTSQYDARHETNVHPNPAAVRDARVLVLLEEGEQIPGDAGTDVVVSGTVRQPSRPELERQYPWLTFTPEVELTAGHGRPIIVAASVRPAPRQAVEEPGEYLE